MGVLSATDRVAGGLALASATLAQMALVALGVHLAADTVDDGLLHGLLDAMAWADAHLTGSHSALAETLGMPADALLWWTTLPVAPISAGFALMVELAADAAFIGTFLLTPRAVTLDRPRFRRALGVRALVTSLALPGVLIAGAWSLAMAAEDVLPGSPAAPWVAGLLGIAALSRFGFPAWRRAVAALDPPRQWSEGLLPALVMVPIGLLAWMHGTPVWGWLP